MTDHRMIRRLSGHTHSGRHETSLVTELDGVPVVVSVDHEAILWTCDLLRGDCTQRPLELDAAGPADDWYDEYDLWEMRHGSEPWPKWQADAGIAAQVTVTHRGGEPVIVTGGGRFDLWHPDFESLSGGVRVWDMRTGRKIGKTLLGHGLGVCSLIRGPSLLQPSSVGL